MTRRFFLQGGSVNIMQAFWIDITHMLKQEFVHSAESK